MLKTPGLFAALLPLVMLAAPPAHADNGPELWYNLENRVTLPDDVAWRPKAFRIITVNFWGARFPGLGQALVRFGPIWAPHPNLKVAFNMVPGMEQDAGTVNQQFRLELEPTLSWEGAGLDIDDRTRVERRWAQSGNRWRVRNQLKVGFPGLNWPVVPFVSNEVFYDLTAQVFNQNRSVLGFTHHFTESIKVDLGYLLRHRLDNSAWDRDHVLSVNFTVDHYGLATGPTP